MNITNFLTKIFGNKSQRDMKTIQPWVEKIKAAYPAIEKLSNDGLRARTGEIMQDLQNCVADKRKHIAELKASIETLPVEKREKVWDEVDKTEKDILDTLEKKLEEYLPEVFSIVKNTAYRFANNETLEVTATEMDRDLAASKDFVSIEGDKAIYKTTWMAGGNPVRWDMVHYDVQLFGGVVLHQGKIAEMATGEGKTLVATLPVFLNALTHNGVHVVTVNDYLAKRDCDWMGPLYEFHGLTVDCIDKYDPNYEKEKRRKAYRCDITFGTNNEFGFDYLRDNMAFSPEDLVQREHNFAIVDEVDSILIDDARTPLIISGAIRRESEYASEEDLYNEYRERVENLVKAQKVLLTQLLTEAKAKVLSDDKQTKDEGATQLFRAYKAWPKNSALVKFLSQPGVKQELLRAESYYLQDNQKEMHVATDPLFFVIDEKQRSVDITDKGIDVLTGKMDDKNFFVLPDLGTEIAEIEHSEFTADEKAEKKEALEHEYALKAERLHAVNQLLKAYTMFEKDTDYIVTPEGEVKIVDEQTGRIMEGRRWSDGLHQAVEAKEHVKIEAATQTQATITLQNYFRMYHKLSGMTGTAETEAGEFWDIYKLDVVTIPTNRPIARKDEDDRIYKTDRAKLKAVVDEIVALTKAGRPVLVGTTSVEKSERLARALQLRGIDHNVLNAKLHAREAEVVALAGQKAVVTIATNMAGRGTDIKLSPEVKAAGGLAIIGTERHESRRVDRQLRGRAGRQGDPGSSVFFVSLEDPLMRVFGSDRIAKLMDSKLFAMSEDDVLVHPWLSKSIENAQKKVEENNFGIRKRLLDYDDVMNAQRKVVYTRRRHAVMGERIGVDFMNTMFDTATALVHELLSSNDYEIFKLHVLQTFGFEPSFGEEEYKRMRQDAMIQTLYEKAMEIYNHRCEKIAQTVGPRFGEIYEQYRDGGQIKRLIVPFSDGKRKYNVPCDLKEGAESQGKSIPKTFLKAILLDTLDKAWMQNLKDLDDLRTNTQMASYEQKDPLVIYKVEAFHIFEEMVKEMNRKAVTILMRSDLDLPEEAQQEMREAAPEKKRDFSHLQTSHGQAPSQTGTPSSGSAQQGPQPAPQTRQPIVGKPHIGRNDPCPCGSGKKYKNCHGKGL